MRAILPLALALLSPLAAAADHPEGVVVDLAPGEHAWPVPEGAYAFVVAANGTGLLLDESGSAPETLPARTCGSTSGGSEATPDPADCGVAPLQGAMVSSVRVANGSFPRLVVQGGSGQAVLARSDFHDAVVEDHGTFGRLRVRGEIASGCRAYDVMDGPFHRDAQARQGGFLSDALAIRVAAPGMDVAYFDSALVERARGEDLLLATLDTERGDAWGLVQMCARDVGPHAFVIQADRAQASALATGARQVDAPAAPLVALGLLVAGVAVRRAS